MDAISETRLAAVHSLLKSKIEELWGQMRAKQIDFRITQGLRTVAEQAALYAKGRNAAGEIVSPGEVVTHAKPGASWHQFGLAVDFAPISNGAPDWDLSHPEWITIRDAGEKLGLVSGSRWLPKSLTDWPHFQLSGVFPVSPTDQVRELYANGGLEAVWNASGLSVAGGAESAGIAT
jgi:peptidoglycan L-alanyl-D-glutamate endopeptidase CwlK